LKITPRKLAFEALRIPDGKPGANERSLDEAFRRNPSMTGRDRAFAVHLVQGVSRWKLLLDWILGSYVRFSFERIEPDVLVILRIALYQMLYMDRVPESAAVNEAVSQAAALGRPHLGRFVNGILREIARRPGKWSFPSREKDLVPHLSVRYSYPRWIVSKWVLELGAAEAEALMEAGNVVSPMVLRATGGEAGREKLIEALSDEGVEAARTGFSPDGVVIHNPRRPVTGIRAFRDGLCTVQGEAAQIASRLLAPVPGEHVLDLCAGVGGKATHLADLMGDSGLVVAMDLNYNRLVELTKSARRMGLSSILAVTGDARANTGGWLKKRFDRIFLDAPCSALGTVSRHPDAKWCRSEEDLARLSRLQADLLDSAMEMLRPGGRLLYATCTISAGENEGVIRECLGRNPSISLENIKTSAPGWAVPLVNDDGYLKCFPHLHGTEGFFGALLVKKEQRPRQRQKMNVQRNGKRRNPNKRQ